VTNDTVRLHAAGRKAKASQTPKPRCRYVMPVVHYVFRLPALAKLRRSRNKPLLPVFGFAHMAGEYLKRRRHPGVDAHQIAVTVA